VGKGEGKGREGRGGGKKWEDSPPPCLKCVDANANKWRWRPGEIESIQPVMGTNYVLSSYNNFLTTLQ